MKRQHRSLIVVAIVALLVLGFVLMISLRHVQLYEVIILPSVGGMMIRPEAINDRGQVVGFGVSGGRTRLLLWDRDNGMQDLGPVLDGQLDINNDGHIAGTMRDPNGGIRAFLWSAQNGKQMLGTLGGNASVALAMNNKAQVVGSSDPAEGLPQPFIWDKANGMRNLSQSRGRATAINDAGQVMGFVMTTTRSQPPVLCFWDAADAVRPSSEPQSPDDYPGGSDLNNNGYVIGKGYNWDKDQTWACIWREETGFKYLFRLEESEGPLVFNDANQVLFNEKHTSPLERISSKYFGPYTQRCLWDPNRGKIVLDRQIPRKTGKLLRVRAINNRGCIVGIVSLKGSGREAAVLLEPIPDRWNARPEVASGEQSAGEGRGEHDREGEVEHR